MLLFVWLRIAARRTRSALLGERATPERSRAHRRCARAGPADLGAVLAVPRPGRPVDFGVSIQTGQPVIDEMLRTRFPATIELAVARAAHRGRRRHPAGLLRGPAPRRPGSTTPRSPARCSASPIPVFFLAFLLKYVFAVKLRLAARRPAGRTPRIDATQHHRVLRPRRPAHRRVDAAWDAFMHLILPAIALATIPLAIIVRITRAAVLDVVNEDYVRTAEAKGLTSAVDPRAGTSCATRCCRWSPRSACSSGLLLSGAVLTETVFAFAGIGKFVADAIQRHGLPGAAGVHPGRSRWCTCWSTCSSTSSYGVGRPAGEGAMTDMSAHRPRPTSRDVDESRRRRRPAAGPASVRVRGACAAARSRSSAPSSSRSSCSSRSSPR